MAEEKILVVDDEEQIFTKPINLSELVRAAGNARDKLERWRNR